MKIGVVGEYIFFSDESLSKLKTLGNLSINDVFPDEQNLIKYGSNLEVLITWGKITVSLLNASKDLRHVVILSTGYDDITGDKALISELKRRNISVSYTPYYSTDAVAEFTLASVLGLTRKVFRALEFTNKGNAFKFEEFKGKSFKNLTVGVVGFGNIGQEFATKANALGAKILSFTKHPEDKAPGFAIGFVALDELFAKSDVIAVTSALNEETRNMIGKSLLRLAKKDVAIVNTARPGIFNLNDLYLFLKFKKQASALIDGLDLKSTLGNKLMKLPNFYATPHVAFNTEESLINCTDIAVNNISEFRKGRKKNLIPLV